MQSQFQPTPDTMRTEPKMSVSMEGKPIEITKSSTKSARNTHQQKEQVQILKIRALICFMILNYIIFGIAIVAYIITHDLVILTVTATTLVTPLYAIVRQIFLNHSNQEE